METTLQQLKDENRIFIRGFESTGIVYYMIDIDSVTVGIDHAKESFYVCDKYGLKYVRMKKCNLELQSKELYALNPTVDKSHAYRYTYKLVPDSKSRFKKSKTFIIEGDELITDELTITRKD